MGRPGTLLRCIECGVESDQLVRGWRAYLMDEDDLRDEDDLEDRVFMFCPVR